MNKEKIVRREEEKKSKIDGEWSERERERKVEGKER